jgi:hypothetical protein
MDASSLDELFKNPFLFNKFTIFKTLFIMGISRGSIIVEASSLPIQEEYFGEEIKVIMGSPHLVDGPWINRLFMGEVHTIASFKVPTKPYDGSIIGEKAVVAANYKNSRIVLSTPHPELVFANRKSGDFFVRNILWCAKNLTAI